MNIVKAVLLKVAATLFFATMIVLVRYSSQTIPLGEVVFFRSAVAAVLVIAIFAWRQEFNAAVRTRRPLGHLGRGGMGIFGMFLTFTGFANLPVVEATAISFAAPLVTVAFAAWFLRERVRIYRWSAVGIGFVGILVMLAPHFEPGAMASAALTGSALGAVCSLGGAITNAGTVIQTRRLTTTETTSAIVFYFSLICALGGAATLPFAWQTPNAVELAALIGLGTCGGLAHLLLTESYRFAPASVVAPFDYTSMLWALLLGYVLFGEVPALFVYIGAAIVAGAGLFVIWRERQLGLARMRAAEGPSPGV